jgi:hypothetical protein
MKRKILKLSAIFATITSILLATGCTDEIEKDNISKYDIVKYKWHLTKFVDIPNKIEKQPLQNSKNVYWIKLDDGPNFEGKAFSNTINGTYTMDIDSKSISFNNINSGTACELYDGDKFLLQLSMVQNLHVSGDTLRLLFNNKMNYLQFERIK